MRLQVGKTPPRASRPRRELERLAVCLHRIVLPANCSQRVSIREQQLDAVRQQLKCLLQHIDGLAVFAFPAQDACEHLPRTRCIGL